MVLEKCVKKEENNRSGTPGKCPSSQHSQRREMSEGDERQPSGSQQRIRVWYTKLNRELQILSDQ